MSNEQADAILKELQMLRKLKMFELVNKGCSQSQLAEVLDVSQPTVSRMLPKASPKKSKV